jgi:hypothetical protein
VYVQYVSEAIFSIKSKAIGLENVSLKFVKLLAPSLIPHITNYFNFCFTHDIFPADWKVSKIIPLPKIFNTSLKLPPYFYFAMFIEGLRGVLNKLLDPLQSGFEANHSTTTALLNVVNDLSRAVDLKCGFVLSLLDFSKAFDSIELLLMQLSNYFNFLHPRFQ